MKTHDDIREYLSKAFKEGHIEKAQALTVLKKYGVETVTRLAEADLDNCYADLIALADKNG